MKIRKTETEVRTVEIEMARVLETIWRPGWERANGEYCRPTRPNGYEYECTNGGQTGSREPKWPTTVAATVVDGSVTWTARAFGTNASDSISLVNVTSPAGITVANASSSGTEVTFDVSGGSQPGVYILGVEVTTNSGEVIEDKVEVTVYDS